MRSSCIAHPKNNPMILVREWQVKFCAGNTCAAALLSFFEYWHNVKIRMAEKNERANDVAEMHGDEGVQDTSLYQFHTSEELQAGIMGIGGEKKIRESLRFLEESGVITITSNPNPRYQFDKTKFFIFHPDVLIQWITEHYNAPPAPPGSQPPKRRNCHNDADESPNEADRSPNEADESPVQYHRLQQRLHQERAASPSAQPSNGKTAKRQGQQPGQQPEPGQGQNRSAALKGSSGSDLSHATSRHLMVANHPSMPGGTLPPTEDTPPDVHSSPATKRRRSTSSRRTDPAVEDLVTRFRASFREIKGREPSGNGRIRGAMRSFIKEVPERDHQLAILDAFFGKSKTTVDHPDFVWRTVEKGDISIGAFTNPTIQEILRDHVQDTIPVKATPGKIEATVYDPLREQTVSIERDGTTWVDGEPCDDYIYREMWELAGRSDRQFDLFVEALAIDGGRDSWAQQNHVRAAVGAMILGV